MSHTTERPLVRPDGRTTCCDAFTTFMDGGAGVTVQVECCKGCYREVLGRLPRDFEEEEES